MNQPPDSSTPGELLRAARRKRGLELEALAVETKIAAPLLHALEQDEYHKISGPIYVRSFLRTYAGALGLDAHRLVGLYEQQGGHGDAAADDEIWDEERVTVHVVGVPYGRILLRFVLPVVLVVLVLAVGLWLRGRSANPARQSVSDPPSLLQGDSARVVPVGASADTGVALPDSGRAARGDSTTEEGSSAFAGRPAPERAADRDGM